MSEAEPPVGPEPDVIIGYRIGLGVAARLTEAMAAGIEQEHGADDPRIAALRSAAGIIRGEEEHFAAQRAIQLRTELAERK